MKALVNTSYKEKGHSPNIVNNIEHPCQSWRTPLFTLASFAGARCGVTGTRTQCLQPASGDSEMEKTCSQDIHIYRYQMSHWAILFNSIINIYISEIWQIGRRFTLLLN